MSVDAFAVDDEGEGSYQPIIVYEVPQPMDVVVEGAEEAAVADEEQRLFVAACIMFAGGAIFGVCIAWEMWRFDR